MNSLLLTGGRVIDPANRFDARADVLILKGRLPPSGRTPRPKRRPTSERLDVSGQGGLPGAD